MDSFDSQGRLSERTTVVNGQIVGRISYDTYNLSSWATSEIDYDGQGKTYRQLVTYDDNHIVETDTDTDGTRPWAKLVSGYDTGHRLDYQISYASDGSRSYHDYDQAGTHSWSEITDNYDAANRLIDEYIKYDDGSSTRQHYDVDNSLNYRSYVQHFDSSGRQDHISYALDNGTAFLVSYDVDDSKTWSSMSETFDASGNMLNEIFYRDDGGRDVVGRILTSQSTSSNQPYYQVQSFDAQGRLTLLEKISAVGDYGIGVYDVDNSQPYASISLNYTGDNQLKNSLTTYDDGHTSAMSYTVNYHPAGTLVDAQGRTTQMTTYSAGVTSVTSYDVNNVQPWRTMVARYTQNPAGEVATSIVYNNDDGTTLTVQPAHPGTYYQATTTLLSADGATTQTTVQSDLGRTFTFTDTAGGHSYYSYTDRYDLYGQLTQEQELLRVGRLFQPIQTTLNTNVNGADPNLSWTSQTSTYVLTPFVGTTGFSSSSLQSYTKSYFDHTSSAVSFDIAQTQPWTSITDINNALGSLIEHDVANDDGSHSTTFYDADNASFLASQTFLYKTNGSLSTITTANDDNSGTRTVFDADNTSDVAYAVYDYDPQGHQTHLTVFYDDGHSLAVM